MEATVLFLLCWFRVAASYHGIDLSQTQQTAEEVRRGFVLEETHFADLTDNEFNSGERGFHHIKPPPLTLGSSPSTNFPPPPHRHPPPPPRMSPTPPPHRPPYCRTKGFPPKSTCKPRSHSISKRLGNSNKPVLSMEYSGFDSDGRKFRNADEMWMMNAGNDTRQEQWYQDSGAYWERVEASVDGVMSGYGHLSDADIQASESFLLALFPELFDDGGDGRHLVALDSCSGIGRITKNLLLRHFNEVDLLEPATHFLDAARESLSNASHVASDSHKTINFFNTSLQKFTPPIKRYDVIWIQWCICHLTDDDFVSFFERSKIGLKPGGFFVLKENIAKSGFIVQKEDRAVFQSDEHFKDLFKRSGLHLHKMKDQGDFPKELLVVRMYALTT